MRTGPIAAMAALLLGGTAFAMAVDPVTSAQDPRWRPWTGYEPPSQPGEGVVPIGIPARSCLAFDETAYNGRRLEVHDGVAFEYVGAGWNDRISSIACAPGCRLIAYQTIVFGGARASFTGSRPMLGPVWDDRISALRVACDGEAAAQ